MDKRLRKLPASMATFVRSPNIGGKFADGLPDTLVIHHTGMDSAHAALERLIDRLTGVSAHVLVGRDGSLTQLVEFDTVAWHSGSSTHGERHGLNDYSLGIELDNAGRLQGAAVAGLRTRLGRSVPSGEAIFGVHRNESAGAWWHAYPEIQLTRVFALTEFLARHFTIRHILGHEEIAPGRKVDPGPAFPLDEFRRRFAL